MSENKDDIIRTWHWRIERVGHTAQSFAALVGLKHSSSLTHYKNGAQKPRDRQFFEIESKLVELEKERGFV